MTLTTVELSVELSCQKCVNQTDSVLSQVPGIQSFTVNLEKQSVVVISTLASSQLLDIIENKVGKRAVIMGMSGETPLGSAVAMLGGLIGSGSIQVFLRHVTGVINLYMI
jgi:copper chaperone CopZ